MNSKAISASDPHFILCSKSKISLLPSLPPHLFFNTQLKKRSFSVKISPGSSYRFRPIATAAATADDFSKMTTAKTETLYDLLGVPESGTLSEIKRAYKRMALKYHPDVSPPERTEEYTRRFIRVQEAYQTLSDPETRAVYDSDMAKGLQLAFTGRKRVRYDRRPGERGDWMTRWQSQIMELKKRSSINRKTDSRGRVTWGARVRRQRSDPF